MTIHAWCSVRSKVPSARLVNGHAVFITFPESNQTFNTSPSDYYLYFSIAVPTSKVTSIEENSLVKIKNKDPF